MLTIITRFKIKIPKKYFQKTEKKKCYYLRGAIAVT